MSATRRAATYKLAAAAQEADLDVMSGILDKDEEGRWLIGRQDLSAWLAAHDGEITRGGVSEVDPVLHRGEIIRGPHRGNVLDQELWLPLRRHAICGRHDRPVAVRVHQFLVYPAAARNVVLVEFTS